MNQSNENIGNGSEEIFRLTIDERAYSVSHRGGRSDNEDAALILKKDSGYILAIADGLGGHTSGEIASKLAIDVLKQNFLMRYTSIATVDDIRQFLEDGYRQAHNKIQMYAIGDNRGMGTTLVTACIHNSKVIIANSGDSRAYIIRDDIKLKTKDHSIVQRLVNEGTISTMDAKNHPLKNMVTSALGIKYMVDFYIYNLQKGDNILLASDGFYDFIDERRMIDIIKIKPAKDAIDTLFTEALLRTTDNVSIVLFHV